MATRIHSGRAGLLVLAGALALCLTAPANGQCVGDCDDSGQVDITDLIRGVNIALGNAPLSQCPSFDCEHNEMVPINCLIQGVNNALSSCPVGPTSTPTGTPVGTSTATITPMGGSPTPTATPEVTATTPPGECPLTPGAYTVTQMAGGQLKVYTFQPFPFPAGGSIVQDVKAATAPDCVHDTVIPFPDGFHAPNFCVPALGYIVSVTQTGCGIGKLDSNGGSDFTVVEVNDTSDSSTTCNLPQAECRIGADAATRVDITVGDGNADTCTSGTANAIVTVPVHTVTWQDMSEGSFGACPGNGVFEEGTDAVITQFNQILDFTTDSTHSNWADLDGDGCYLSGGGPAVGQPTITGTCLDLGTKMVTTVASGGFGSTGVPDDGSFSTTLPNIVTGPEAPLDATCGSPPAINFGGKATRCLP
jgi:hypothetical protein